MELLLNSVGKVRRGASYRKFAAEVQPAFAFLKSYQSCGAEWCPLALG